MTAALPRAGHVAGCAGVAEAVSQFAAGGAVLVWDPAVEGEADVVLPGVRLKPASFTFLLREVCGYPCVPCAASVLDRLDIKAIPGEGDRQHTAFCTPVDLAAGAPGCWPNGPGTPRRRSRSAWPPGCRRSACVVS